MEKKSTYASIDEYIKVYPEDVQKKLTQLRKLIILVAPQAEERISYQMPAYFLNGILVWFAAHSMHIGFYPKASAIAKFKRELSGYKSAKGSVQFPLNKPLPADLIKRIVRFRVEENDKKAMQAR